MFWVKCKTADTALRLFGKMCRTDMRTVFGTNLRNIAIDCKIDIDSLTPNIVKNAMSYFTCPDLQ